MFLYWASLATRSIKFALQVSSSWFNMESSFLICCEADSSLSRVDLTDVISVWILIFWFSPSWISANKSLFFSSRFLRADSSSTNSYVSLSISLKRWALSFSIRSIFRCVSNMDDFWSEISWFFVARSILIFSSAASSFFSWVECSMSVLFRSFNSASASSIWCVYSS